MTLISAIGLGAAIGGVLAFALEGRRALAFRHRLLHRKDH